MAHALIAWTWVPSATGAALRLAGYAVLSLCGLAVLAHLVAGWIMLRQLQIPVLTHVAELIHGAPLAGCLSPWSG
jgi:hypothetical protein